MKVSDISLDNRNYRKHSEKNLKLIRDSLRELGAGRSILIDRDNMIIAGNGVFQQANALGIPIKIIETDGSKLIAIRRKDLSSEDERRSLLAISDNKTSDESSFDLRMVLEDFDKAILENLGFESFESQLLEDLDFEGKNKEVPIEQLHGDMKLTLNFSESDYFRVTQRLDEMGPNRERAILKILGLYE